MTTSRYRPLADLYRLLYPTCAWCESDENPEVDHVVPLFAGGLDHPSNLQTLCRECHAFKTDMDQQTYSTAYSIGYPPAPPPMLPLEYFLGALRGVGYPHATPQFRGGLDDNLGSSLNWPRSLLGELLDNADPNAVRRPFFGGI